MNIEKRIKRLESHREVADKHDAYIGERMAKAEARMRAEGTWPEPRELTEKEKQLRQALRDAWNSKRG